MGLIGGQVGYSILKIIAPRRKASSQSDDEGNTDTKIELFFGSEFFEEIKGKTIIDFGCGSGRQSVEMAQRGGAKVIGIDIQERLLESANQHAAQCNVVDRCIFSNHTTELADIIISKDAFEHYSDPSEVLQTMASLLKPEGYVLAAFGPTWLHPYGGHLFSIFPWSHLLFSEEAQIRWRSDFKTDGASCFSEVEGGLNQLTISQFERIVAHSLFRFEWLETVPIRGFSPFKTRALREIGSSIVRCKLSLK